MNRPDAGHSAAPRARRTAPIGRWLRAWAGWLLAWLLLSAGGAAWLAHARLVQLQQDFETDARIAHRLLSQQVVQYDAVLATLALLEPGAGPGRPEQRLSSVYASILGVLRRDASTAWPDGPLAPRLAQAEAQSRSLRRPVLASADLAHGRYWLVMGATPISYALDIDLAGSVPWRDWPMDPGRSPVRVSIELPGQAWVVQPGRIGTGGWRYDFRKVLAAESQAFSVVASRQVGWPELPWRWMAGWAIAVAAVLGGLNGLQRQRVARRRAEELLRLGQVARLDSLGELTAGLAHELNQPLTAVLANTQAARRLIDEDPPDLATARQAMGRAAEQSRRAAGVIGRLRRVIERPETSGATRPVVLQDLVRELLHLLEPEFAQRGVAPVFDVRTPSPVRVQAEPVALEQILHNLLMNALQALDHVAASERSLSITVAQDRAEAVVTVEDSGPGIAPEALPRLFEPFFSTRSGGLGLGLSLSETLAGAMGGRLAATQAEPRGACFTLRLPVLPADR